MRIKNLLRKFVITSLCTTIGFSALAFGASHKTEAATEQTVKLLSTGKEYIGTPYKLGSQSGVTSSFDCSSFSQYIFKLNGVKLPRTASAQAKVGKPVAKGYLSVGDLVFFKTNGKSISHVAIYAGNSKILHSSSSKGVIVANMNSSYWKTKYVTARRVSL
ncbi:C40 family peptidase [Paenibacillus mendelii]|uniref:C40 family peptidase n=1 Tax=Paenibacillus mendelii TaxID=206163 RepID=A0ABV6JIC5_9BACL|nr:C40 family peptidase [Paenibacillus mendelii]MCQ6558336.1 C40 family peptidase [Paenibacillus mendelii]